MLFIINLILGLGLLLSGRKLFWIFVAAAGFFVGVEITARYWKGPEWLSIVVGVVLGILFALLALGLKTLAISIAGFFLGGSALFSLATAFGFERGIFVLYIIGGVLGVIFISVFFDWALITISSLAGASMIAQTLDITRPVAGLVFIGLLIVGIVVQSNDLQKDKKLDG
ncbi:MAG TPA: hypothetical protein VFI68_12440 [Anaerolineales bacterium]|nr:hypothetical protein [Anaerolineales bacterium]